MIHIDVQLIEAAKDGNASLCLTLIDHGADVNARDDHGSMPLHWAAEKGKTETVFALIAHRADVNAQGRWGAKPLHLAAEKGHAKIALALIAHGADVHVRDDSGTTPLHRAGSRSHEVIVLLIAHGADPSHAVLVRHRSSTQRQAAAKGGFNKILIELLIDHPSDALGDDPNSLIKLAKKYGQTDTAALIQSHLAMKAIEPIESLIAKIKSGTVLNDPIYQVLDDAKLESVRALQP